MPCSSPNANATICADPNATAIFEASRNGNTTSSYDIVLENEAALASEKPEFDTCFFDFDTGVDGVLAETITAFDVADYFTHSDRGAAADTEEDTRNLPFDVCPNVRAPRLPPSPRSSAPALSARPARLTPYLRLRRSTRREP